jgi:hypothetical protein
MGTFYFSTALQGTFFEWEFLIFRVLKEAFMEWEFYFLAAFQGAFFEWESFFRYLYKMHFFNGKVLFFDSSKTGIFLNGKVMLRKLSQKAFFEYESFIFR